MKKLKILLIILLIINSIVLICLLAIPKIEAKDYMTYAIEREYERRKNGEVDTSNDIKTVRENITSFENEYILLSNYCGDLSTGNVNVKFTDLISGGFVKFYTDTEGMNKTTLAKYFDTNKDTIAMQTGITTAEDFANFIKKIQIYKNKDISCEKVTIVEGSFAEAEDDYVRFNVKLIYDNEQELEFTVYLSNSDFRDTPIIIIK